MIVIADTSPISYLILIGEADILSKLYGKVLIPRAVFDELTSLKGPLEVRDWFNKQPDWLITVDLTGEVDEELVRLLDKGESEAIQLARKPPRRSHHYR